VGEVLADLDRRFPGLRFRVIDEQDRVRRHMRIFVGARETRDVAAPLADGEEVLIFGALSGG
jgi:molybdopterin converting factor small subunit